MRPYIPCLPCLGEAPSTVNIHPVAFIQTDIHAAACVQLQFCASEVDTLALLVAPHLHCRLPINDLRSAGAAILEQRLPLPSSKAITIAPDPSSPACCTSHCVLLPHSSSRTGTSMSMLGHAPRRYPSAVAPGPGPLRSRSRSIPHQPLAGSPREDEPHLPLRTIDTYAAAIRSSFRSRIPSYHLLKLKQRWATAFFSSGDNLWSS